MNKKLEKRGIRHRRIRAKMSGTSNRPRLAVFRSLKHISAQLIDDSQGKTLASATSLKIKKDKGVAMAKQVGIDLAKAAEKIKISRCVFDRGGYLYHGRVKAVAEGAREAGMQF